MDLCEDTADAAAWRNPERTLFSGALQEHAAWLRKYVKYVDRVQGKVPDSAACGSGVQAVRKRRSTLGENEGVDVPHLSPSGAQSVNPETLNGPGGSDEGYRNGVMMMDAQRRRSVKPEPRPMPGSALAADVPGRRSAKPEPRPKPAVSCSSHSSAAIVHVPERQSMEPTAGERSGNGNHSSPEPMASADNDAGSGTVVAQVEDAPAGLVAFATNAAD
eukprot:TRINITY_DN7477_c0_g2_i1.p1 TRINITY_DN7477_c0_g2~~TRINITY_DN7477_c0_g2_i1.p1  ORF type:complete len:240 (+),score=21.87 TRINITY_DN7477_c0_g2_i1:68-721(+)